MPVLSVRLSEQELKRLQSLAKGEGKEKSSLARELIIDGLKYKKILAYKEGTISLSRLSKTLGLSLSEAIDLLASLGIPSPINYDDYLVGLETMRKVGSG
jgi:predicted HTH domain antitoxin